VGQDGKHIGLIWVSEKQKYFFKLGLTGFSLICPSGKSADRTASRNSPHRVPLRNFQIRGSHEQNRFTGDFFNSLLRHIRSEALTHLVRAAPHFVRIFSPRDRAIGLALSLKNSGISFRGLHRARQRPRVTRKLRGDQKWQRPM
jgi:hypothetical protein